MRVWRRVATTYLIASQPIVVAVAEAAVLQQYMYTASSVHYRIAMRMDYKSLWKLAPSEQEYGRIEYYPRGHLQKRG